MLEVYTRDERDNFVAVSFCAGCELEVCTRKMCVTMSLWCSLCARILHKKDVRDNFLTGAFQVYTRKKCVIIS